MPPRNDIFQTFDLKCGMGYKPCDDIVAKVDYIEQTDAGLKVHCHKVEKEKKMNKNEEFKNASSISIEKKNYEENTVLATLYGRRPVTNEPYVIKTCIARCDPNDIFDFNIGAKLAFDRLYEGYDFTPRSKDLFSGRILFVDPDHEDNKFVYGCSYWEVKDGLITSLGYANPKDPNLRILRDMPCSKLTKRVKDMYFPCCSDWSKRNKVMYLKKE